MTKRNRLDLLLDAFAAEHRRAGRLQHALTNMTDWQAAQGLDDSLKDKLAKTKKKAAKARAAIKASYVFMGPPYAE